MSEKAQVVEAVATAVAPKFTYIGGGAAVAAFFTSLEPWVPWLGVLIALAGFIVTLYFQIRRDRREAKESQERIKMYGGGCVKD